MVMIIAMMDQMKANTAVSKNAQIKMLFDYHAFLMQNKNKKNYVFYEAASK